MANATKVLLTLGVMMLILTALPGLSQAQGAEPRRLAPGEAIDFEVAVGLALRQSPLFTKSALEIDLKRLDETDSRTAFVPSITLRTRYFIDRPKTSNLNPRAYSVSFLTEDYNPIEAYFSLQVRKLFTRMAVLSHLRVIAEGLHRLAQAFLQLDALTRLTPLQEKMVKLAKENLTYAREREKIREGTSHEVRLASQELSLSELEQRHLTESRESLQRALKSLLGLEPDMSFTFDLRQVRGQILENFEATRASLEEAQRRSLDLKIQALKKELQAKNVSLAKTKLLPSFFVGVETPDPLSSVETRGYFFSIGLKWPVWDGFRRVRNISRQKTILKQFDADSELKEMDLADKWGEATERLRTALRALKLVQARQEVARLKAKQSDIHYQAGEPLAILLESRREYLEAEQQTLMKSLEYDLAVLAAAHLSGELVSRYVDESSWQN